MATGFFYFEQARNHLLKSEEFGLIEYARHIKMGDSIDSFNSEYSYRINHNKKHINIRNFKIEDRFSKLIPISHKNGYIEVFKTKNSFDKNIMDIRIRIISIQILLLLLFAYISYRLANDALKPFRESIATLDKFAKDLIHDLNTPVTSIKLNMRLLEKKIPEITEDKVMIRLNKSVNNISELHENLTILLEEKTFQLEMIDLCEIVDDIIEVQKPLYPDINFISDCKQFKAKVNAKAIKQILQNLISNASKYNNKNGYIKIYHKENRLYIEDSGKGIKEPQKIFDRDYSTEDSSGIGLDIVKRLAKAMDIEVRVTQNSKIGVTFVLIIN